jgi:flagellar motor switch protein FliM
MPEKDVLSQEEIDALLHSVDSGDTTTEDHADEDLSAESANALIGGDHVRTINFSTQERIVKGQLPVLDKIHDRAVRHFAADIYQLTGRDFEIKQEPLAIIKHPDFMQSLPNPSLMSIYRFRPLRGKALVIFDSIFVYDLVDYYFGGSTQFLAQKERTDFTATELRVMDSVTKKLIDHLLSAWKPIMAVSIVKINDETNPQLVNIGETNDMLLVTRFSIDFGKESGSFHIVLPYSLLEPIKQQLELGASRPDEEIDPNWIMSLRAELMDVSLKLGAAMSETQSTLGKVMSWKIGDFVLLEADEIVEVDIEGTPCFKATLGTAGDNRALQILHSIKY